MRPCTDPTRGWVKYSVTKRLFTLSPVAKDNQWSKFVSNNPDIIPLRDTPRLLLRQQGTSYPQNVILQKIHWLFHSFWLNWKAGISGILATWSLTGLPCIIWAMAWYTGWHISFNKMYEESATGVSLSFLGIFLFSLVMLYLPLAQARQGFTGDWQSFFDFRFIKTMVCNRPIQILLLAVGYTICGIILTFVKIMPVFFPARNPMLESLSPKEALTFLNDYYFNTGLVAILLFFVLKTLAGRIYADALKAIWTQKLLAQGYFHPQEVHILKLFNLDYGSSYQQPQLLTKVVKFPFFLSYKGAINLATFLLWGIFSFMPFVSQFFNYYPFWGFLNQPLVQLPCFRYVPAQLGKLKNKSLASSSNEQLSKLMVPNLGMMDSPKNKKDDIERVSLQRLLHQESHKAPRQS